MSDSPSVPAPILPRWRIVLIFALGVIGFAASVAAIYATPIEGVTDLGCGLRVLDCSEVLGSRWGKVVGIPLGVLGGFYFAFWTLILATWQKSKNPLFRWVLTWILTLGFAVSLLLLLLLLFVIEGNCLFCLITHTANIASAFLLWPLRQYTASLPLIRKEFSSLIAVSVIAFLIGLGLFQLYQLRVDRATAKSKEQTIW